MTAGLAFYRAVWVIVIACILSFAPVPWSPPAQARTIFEMLFDRPKIRPAQNPQPRDRIQRPKRKEFKDAAGKKKAKAKQAEVSVKRPDAKKILVSGDFMANALADGLTAAFATSPDISIEARFNGSSGLARKDYHDWAKELPLQIDAIKPAAIILMFGANDRQYISINGQKEKFGSALWTVEYDKRVTDITRIALARKIPLIWVGLPPFQSAAMTADAETLNGFYRNQTEKVGGEFVDIWEGFVGENGLFVISGFDINGQSVRLRGADGISLTKAGKRKMAFYVEKSLRQRLGNPTALLRLDTPNTADSAVKPTVHIVKVAPISLADPNLDGGEALFDAPPKSTTPGQTARDLLVDRGDTGSPPSGRVDDFRTQKPVMAR